MSIENIRKVCKIADVKTSGSSSSWGDAKLDSVWATCGQHANFFTRTKYPDLRWAAPALRSDGFVDRPGLGKWAARRAAPAPESKYAVAATHDLMGEQGELDWDDIVDIVCVGRGVGALAAAL